MGHKAIETSIFININNISLKSIDLYFKNMNTIITSPKNLSIQSPFRITIPIRNEETTKYSTLQAPYKSYRMYEKSKTLENKNHIGIDVLNRYKNYAGVVKTENLRLKYDSDVEKKKAQEILHQIPMSMESIAPNNMLIASRKLKDFEPKPSDIRFPLRKLTRHPSSVGKIYSETVKALCIENPILNQVQHCEVAPLNSLL